MFIPVVLPILIAVIFLLFAVIYDDVKKQKMPKPNEMCLCRRRFFRIAGAAWAYLGLVPTLIYGIFGIANSVLLFVGLYLFFVPELKLIAYKIFPKAAKAVMRTVWIFFFIGLTTALTMFGFLVSAQFNTPIGKEGVRTASRSGYATCSSVTPSQGPSAANTDRCQPSMRSISMEPFRTAHAWLSFERIVPRAPFSHRKTSACKFAIV